MVTEAKALLQREVELLEIVRLVGSDALDESERGILTVARILREDFLQQSAYHEVDRFCPLAKSYWMLQAILSFYHVMKNAMGRGIALQQITTLPVLAEIARMKEIPVDEAEGKIKALLDRVHFHFAEWGVSANGPQ